MRSFSNILPWVVVLILLIFLMTRMLKESNQPERIVTSDTILKEIESLGKMELVKYNFKEITELTDVSETYLNLFKLGPDQKIALISEGQAVGCIDLTILTDKDLMVEGDTMFIRLPRPEICYYKLDMERTRIYSLQTNPFEDDSKFIQDAYKHAEREIRQAAMRSGILDQTRTNAELVLKPFLENVSGKHVVIQFGLDMTLPQPVIR